MSPARRSITRRDWPRGLREPRPGYYAWQHPDGNVLPIGRVPIDTAKDEAAAANRFVAQQQEAKLVARLQGASQTIADLLELMPAPENRNTAKSVRSLDGIIRRQLGVVQASGLTVKHCADMLDAVVSEGKARTAQALRSRLMAVCRKGMAKGWMQANPADATEVPEVLVQRGRLTLDSFRSIHARAAEVAEWLPHAMMLALVSGQDRSTVAAMQRQHVADGHLTTWRTKTRKTNQPVAIPLSLRMDAVGVSLAELVSHRTGVVSRYLVHHVSPWGNAPTGSKVFPDRITKAFTAARVLAGIPDALPDGTGAPTFHEIRSLAKRLYTAQGNVDTKALMGHATDRMGALYEDPRGAEPIFVRVG